MRTSITWNRAPSKATVSGNRMPNVWIDRVRGSSRARPYSSRSRPMSPRIRSRRWVGTSARHRPPRGSRKTTSLTRRRVAVPSDIDRPGCALAGRDVLVEPEEVVRVVRPLEGLQSLVLLRSIGLADPVLPLVHEEVHVHARVVRLES